MQLRCAMHREKCFVYLLRSANERDRPYVGLASDVVARLAAHNAGRSPHTARFKPWELVVAMEFTDEATAIRFERYLKSGSGRAFAKRHFAEPSAPVVEGGPPGRMASPR